MSKVMTNKVRLSYAHLFEAKLAPGAKEPKYSTCILIPKSDAAGLKKIEAAIEDARKEGIAKFGESWAKGKAFKLPLWDADLDEPKDGYEGCMCFNASNSVKPGIINRKGDRITDIDEVYSGMYAYVTINFYPFNVDVNKGIAASLQNVLKYSDGDRLDGKTSAEADFADVLQFEDPDDYTGGADETSDIPDGLDY